VFTTSRSYDGNSSTLRVARNDAVGWWMQQDVDQDVQSRAALVLSELATNAVQTSPDSTYSVRLTVSDDRSAVVAVTSHTEFELPPPRDQWHPHSVLAPRGRGLMIVDALADDVAVDLASRDTVVVMATFRSSSPD
jgi:anti-sigma regulatory factor (Ser/Thr protein kinase)